MKRDWVIAGAVLATAITGLSFTPDPYVSEPRIFVPQYETAPELGPDWACLDELCFHSTTRKTTKDYTGKVVEVDLRVPSRPTEPVVHAVLQCEVRYVNLSTEGKHTPTISASYSYSSLKERLFRALCGQLAG